jgi:hypothetical protein
MPSPEEIQQVTREIVGRPEFQPEAAWEGWSTLFGGWWKDVFRALALWLQSYPALKWVVLGGLSLVLLMLLVRLISALRAGIALPWQPARRLRVASAAFWNATEGVPPSWHEALQEVRRAIGQGDGYGAIRGLHRCFVEALEQRGLLACAPWKTNTDYVRECPSPSAAYSLLADITRAYERIVYAHRPVPLHTISELLTQVEDDQSRHRP